MTTHWQVTTVIAAELQTPTARSFRLALSEPFKADAGAHVDIRLTAEDGYSTARAYSLSDVRETRTIEVTVADRGGQIGVSVENPAPDRPARSDGHHIALENIGQRLQALYGGDGRLQVTRREGHYRIELSYPVGEVA